MTNNTALITYLAPFYALFNEEGVNEIMINKPCEVWVEKRGAFRKEEDPRLDFDHLYGLAKLIAQATDQFVSEERPLLSASLPNGYRVQVVLPPACEPKTIAFAIRKSSTNRMSLDDYEKAGAFDKIVIEEQVNQEDIMLKEMLVKHQFKDFLSNAVKLKKNIVISGGTSTGKTTFTNAALMEMPKDERIITVEDTREISLPDHENHIHLLASKGGQGRAKVTTQDLIECCLRLRPDRIIVGEVRGAEAFSFLRAINTGHPGSIATLHADTPQMAIEQLKLMVMQAGLNITPDEIKKYILSVIDIVVQLKRPHGSHKRYVSEIYFKFMHHG